MAAPCSGAPPSTSIATSASAAQKARISQSITVAPTHTASAPARTPRPSCTDERSSSGGSTHGIATASHVQLSCSHTGHITSAKLTAGSPEPDAAQGTSGPEQHQSARLTSSTRWREKSSLTSDESCRPRATELVRSTRPYTPTISSSGAQTCAPLSAPVSRW